MDLVGSDLSMGSWEFTKLEILFSADSMKGQMALEFLNKCAQDSLLLHFNDAATRIQARARGIKGRKLHKEKQKEVEVKKDEHRHLSATKIQASYRGKRGRTDAKTRKTKQMSTHVSADGHLMAATRDDEAYARCHDGAGDDVSRDAMPPGSTEMAVPKVSSPSAAPESAPSSSATPSRPVVPQNKQPTPPAGSARDAISFFRNDVSGVLITEDQISAVWQYYDVDQNGYLDREEVKGIYRSFDTFGVEDNDKRVDAVLAKYNMLGDNKVTYNEFAILMLDIARR